MQVLFFKQGLGKIVEVELKSPGMYYVRANQEGDIPNLPEVYVVMADAPAISEKARTYGQEFPGHPDLRVYDIQQPGSGRYVMSFWTEQDVLQYLKITGIPLAPVYGEIVQVDAQMNLFEEEQPQKLKTTGCDRTRCMHCMFGIMSDKEPTVFSECGRPIRGGREKPRAVWGEYTQDPAEWFSLRATLEIAGGSVLFETFDSKPPFRCP